MIGLSYQEDIIAKSRPRVWKKSQRSALISVCMFNRSPSNYLVLLSCRTKKKKTNEESKERITYSPLPHIGASTQAIFRVAAKRKWHCVYLEYRRCCLPSSLTLKYLLQYRTFTSITVPRGLKPVPALSQCAVQVLPFPFPLPHFYFSVPRGK